MNIDDVGEERIAVVGLSCRMPGAPNHEIYWKNICEGKESISIFSKDELTGAISDELLSDIDFVPAKGLISDCSMFDGDFFGLSKREAEILDPQQRVFLETCWHGLEDAGYVGSNYPGLVGIYAGMGQNSYFTKNLMSNPEVIENFGQFQTMVCNEKDFLATRVAYMLGLKGPAISLNTGCSTSLVAICQASDALLSYQCDMALAGGVSIQFPEKNGYLFYEGGIGSNDGHCRPFDANADGTVFSSGSGVVVLKRLTDAIKDDDHIYAVIRGTGVNNDGSNKLSFTAPSIEGQSNAVMLAHAASEINPEDIHYIEAHGTATPVGDPIEIEALTQAFRSQTALSNFCAIGSVKANIGHTDTAAGVAGFIKAVLSIYHRVLPPSINYSAPNPDINFSESPFYINTKLSEWPNPELRVAGVSSFGVGGTNAHLLIESAPKRKTAIKQSCKEQLLILSAKTKQGLEVYARNLAAYLKSSTHSNLADVADTLKCGRSCFEHRLAVTGSDSLELANTLCQRSNQKKAAGKTIGRNPSVVFMLPGGGSQYINMGKGLYQSEPVFADSIDRGLLLMEKSRGDSLRELWFSNEPNGKPSLDFTRPSIQLPAIFIFEMALYDLWMAKGIKPEALIGHSVGENTAGCISGVFSYPEALKLVSLRGQLFESVSPGRMLSISASSSDISADVTKEYDIASINAPEQCTISGTENSILALQSKLENNGIECQIIPIDIAAHSRLLDPILDKFSSYLNSLELGKPTIPFISNLSGDWITDEQATDPNYWVKHLRNTVRFSEGILKLLKQDNRVFIEVGGGKTLCSLVKSHAPSLSHRVISSTRHAEEIIDDEQFFNLAIGKLWITGHPVDWSKQTNGEWNPRRISLPGYPFEKNKYFIEANSDHPSIRSISSNSHLSTDLLQTSTSNEVSNSDEQNKEPIDRKQLIHRKITTVLQELSGLEEDEIRDDETFIDMGFDSLFLSQASMKFKKIFCVKITFSRLLTEANTLEKLTDFIDESAPIEALSDELNRINEACKYSGETRSADSPTTSNSNSLFKPGNSIELDQPLTSLTHTNEAAMRIVAMQITLMKKQINILQNANGLSRPSDLSQLNTLEKTLDKRSSGEPVTTNIKSLKTSPGQREIWTTAQFGAAASCSYNLCNWLELKGDIDVSALEKAFISVCDRHDALRSTISSDGLMQIIDIKHENLLSTISISHLDEGGLSKNLEAHLDAEVRTSFDLEHGPLIRGSLFIYSDKLAALVITVHHIICDAMSLNIIIDDIGEFYSAAIEGRLPRHRDLIQPIDLELPDEKDIANDLEYWLEKFKHNHNAVELPSDFPPTDQKTYNAGYKYLQINTDLSQKIKARSAENSTTNFCFLFSLFQFFISKISQTKDITIGVPVSTADRTDVDTVGYYLNVLPIKNTLNYEQSFTDYLSENTQSLFLDLDHKDLTFSTLIENLKVRRDFGRNTLVSVLFNLDYESSGPVFGDLNASHNTAGKAFENFDLFFCIVQHAGELGLECVYSTDMFSQETIEYWLRCFTALLDSITSDTNQKLSNIQVATSQDQAKLTAFNSTSDLHLDRDLAPTYTHRLATKESKLPALIDTNNELTFTELEDRTNQLANYLTTQGIGPGSLVGICIDRSIEMVVVILGIWKAGAAYVPLDPDYPADRLSYMLKTASVEALLTEVKYLDVAPDYSCRRICIDRDQKSITQAGNKSPAVSVAKTDTAYVIFTSGSTGKPKGVQVLHCSVCNLLASLKNIISFDEKGILLAVSSLSFDISVPEMLLPLVSGGAIVVASKEEAFDGRTLANLIDTHKATFLDATPSTWRLLLDSGWQGNANLTAISTGEALPRDIALKLLPKVGELWNMYGPTETTVWSTCYRITDAEAPLLIGTPIANTQCHVLDENLQPLPIGVPGELYIGGDGVTAGYLHQDELTAERFIADPFNNEPGARLYRTGDLVRWRHSGQLEYFNRVDSQVKVRGCRIELAEIEAALSSHDQVNACIVIVREDQPGDQRLVAYVVTGGSEITMQAMRQYLSATLPNYMIPQHLVTLDQLPLTPNGKIDKNALHEPDNYLEANTDSVAPESEFENYICDIFKEGLRVEQVNLSDDFFELGGHSLLAAQILNKISKNLEIELSINLLFENSTIGDVVSSIEKQVFNELENISDEDAEKMLSEGKF